MREVTYDSSFGRTFVCEALKANARLIAAAPELLAACIEALYWMNCDSRGEEACAKQLDAAITKAEGRAE
jgi:hypothetical protein